MKTQPPWWRQLPLLHLVFWPAEQNECCMGSEVKQSPHVLPHLQCYHYAIGSTLHLRQFSCTVHTSVEISSTTFIFITLNTIVWCNLQRKKQCKEQKANQWRIIQVFNHFQH